jgi:hypothetical protein
MMAKKTKKFLAACHALNVSPDNTDMPNAALYGLLAMRNYIWNGEHWLRPETPQKRATVRVWADGEDIGDITMLIASALTGMGFEIDTLSKPYQDRDGGLYRQYINFTY